MVRTPINEQIIKEIQIAAANDVKIKDFLITIMITESERSGEWNYKKIYRDKIIQCLKEDVINEN
jgi:hypothetical protein